MALAKGKARQTTSVERVSEGMEQYMRLLRDGTLGVAELIALLSLEGRVFTANAGSATTPISYNAGGLVTTEFDLHVAVPASVAIIPLELTITFEAFGTALLVECVMQSGSGSVSAGTAVTPINSNINAPRTSSCTVTYVTAAATAFTTNVKEIWRASNQLAITTATVAQIRSPYVYTWRAKDSGILDVVGPNQQVGVWASANAGTGMIAFKYAELPSAAVA